MCSRLLCFVLVCLSHVSALAADPAPGRAKGKTVLVDPTAEGRLRYQPYSAQGDTLPDFSHCGYGGGGVPLPEAAVREELRPEGGASDDAPRIQAAIDRVAKLAPGADGLRGAVLLRRGTYRCGESLRLTASGVVLRGEGDGEDGTVIIATARKQQPLIRIGGASGPREEAGTRREITDAYVSVGARSFTVADAAGYAIGQTVWVVRRGNAAWISAIGMDRIVPRPSDPKSTKQWAPFDLKFDRVITAIDGRRVTVDAPIACAIDQRWGGGALVRTKEEGRIERCGVEHLRGVAVFDRSKTADYQGEKVFVDEEHATYLVAFGAVRNAWARRVTTVGFYHGPTTVTGAAKWVTVEDGTALAPVSQITGGRRYPFGVDGQLTLVQRCRSDRARHAFVVGSRVSGPNVFLDCVSTHDYATSEPHHRWSVGGLYDNVTALMAVQDRGHMGSGHGWAGANYVVWNSRGSLICQQPPTAQNFSIGFLGTRGKDAFPRPAGWWESEGTPVEPRSLYRAQLAARLAGAQLASQPDFGHVPGVIVDYSPAASGLYLGSPSLAVLPNGDYVASHDFFGPKSNEHVSARSAVFRSSDRGATWKKVSEIQGAFWSKLFVHRGTLYFLGTDRHHGNCLIRKSTDGGSTWTSPVDGKTGLLRANGEYHCAPMPVIEHQGRLWRTMEWRHPPEKWGVNYRAGMLSIPVDGDLLDASQWTFAEFLPSDRAWNGGDMGAWLEGNAVVALGGEIVNVLRVQTKSPDEKAAIVRVSADGRVLTFDPEKDFVPFAGGAKKFTIHFDMATKLYWSVASIVAEKHRADNPGGIRNTLALVSSPDLRTWTTRTVLLYHPEVKKHGFQYVDWQFDGDDIIAACRTAYDDGVGGAHNNHDANFLTFHRWKSFRALTMADAPAAYGGGK